MRHYTVNNNINKINLNLNLSYKLEDLYLKFLEKKLIKCNKSVLCFYNIESLVVEEYIDVGTIEVFITKYSISKNNEIVGFKRTQITSTKSVKFSTEDLNKLKQNIILKCL